ncbi:MAG: GntR family transcriptional regulator [Anaerovoracaceae bacterium]
MITFDQFKLEDGMPIYLQIVLYIKRGIIAGVIVDGDELPSRRILSALLGVNPNTVQKTYRILEDEGLIQSHAGTKSYMVLDEEKVRRIRQELLEGDARAVVSAMKQMGLSLDEATALLKKFWD